MKQCHFFNKISVIQSLGENEHHTGTKLHEDIKLHNIIHDRGLEIELLETKSKSDFIHVFETLTNEAQNKGVIPVVHIESHGSEDTEGLILSSGEFLDWNELKIHAVNLNIATKNNLLIVLAACHGANFAKKLVPSDRAPCWGLAGPTKAVSSDSILRSFSSFYQEILKSGSGGKAVKKLNENCQEGDIEYYFITAETFFTLTYQNYITYLCCDNEYTKRAKSMRKKLKKEKILPLPSVGSLKRLFKNSQEHFFEKYRTKFFMYDLYPENTERFTVNYEDIRNGVNAL